MNHRLARTSRRVGRGFRCEALEPRALLSSLGSSLPGGIPVVVGTFPRGPVEYAVPGIVASRAGFQSQYTGPRTDDLLATEAGAILLRGHQVELGAILRGPVGGPQPVSYVFALDR